MPDQDVILLDPEPAETQGWYSDETATFGDRLAGAREALGLSDEALAKRLGVKLKTVRAWEQDLSEPRANKLQMLSGLLNVSLAWLLTGDGEGLADPEESGASGEAADLLLELRQIKSELAAATNRMGVLEKRLAAALGAQGQ